MYCNPLLFQIQKFCEPQLVAPTVQFDAGKATVVASSEAEDFGWSRKTIVPVIFVPLCALEKKFPVWKIKNPVLISISENIIAP